MPAIVTTAQLFLCEFDPADVDGRTGEIPYDKARLTPQDAIFFEYPLPRHLQREPAELVNVLLTDSFAAFTTRHIIVIRSTYLPEFLKSMQRGLADSFHGRLF